MTSALLALSAACFMFAVWVAWRGADPAARRARHEDPPPFWPDEPLYAASIGGAEAFRGTRREVIEWTYWRARSGDTRLPTVTRIEEGPARSTERPQRGPWAGSEGKSGGGLPSTTRGPLAEISEGEDPA